MALTREQQTVLDALLREGRRISDPRVRRIYERAAVETGLVESGLRNLPGGDADSAGWRQERASLYPDPTNLTASARRFRQEFQQAYDPGERSYEVAAQVQRPRADLRGRYHDVAAQAAQILGGRGTTPSAPSSGSLMPSSGPASSLAAPMDPGQGADATALLQLLGQRERPVIQGSTLQAPAATAGPVMPAAYRALSSSGGPRARQDISQLLAAAQTPGQSVGLGQAVSDASGPVSASGTPSSGGGGSKGFKGSGVRELIFNDGGKGYGIKDGRTVDGASVYGAVWAGHANHVHVAAGPKTVVELGQLAQDMGLHVGENPHFGGVTPVHVDGSYHYRGQAIDVSGDPRKMAAFARKVATYNRTRRL